MTYIKFYNQDCDFLPKQRMKISSWIKETIINEGFKLGEICYIFCSQKTHLEINQKYLGHDYQTDIITFDYTDYEKKRISGDIFIDPQTVLLNSQLWHTEPEEEILRVIIHGILHLCGYKDKTPEDETVMRAKENYYLNLFKA